MKIFIDGKSGTTGLRIYERLADRTDVDLILLSEEQRKDSDCRREALRSADVAFLCLPDAAAEEAVAMTGSDTVIIDTSTAHRTLPNWAYGFPELSAEHEKRIASSNRIAVPGCHASGFIALVYPLIESGILHKNSLLSCFSLTGYSGGGKKMIAEYESDAKTEQMYAPRQYGLTQQHKHLKEMRAVTGLDEHPIFCPIVDDFYSGMQVTVPLFASQINGSADDIKKVYEAKYSGPIVSFEDCTDGAGMLSAAAMTGKDSMKIAVFGNDDRILLTAVYDNLGKGASGAALECLNIVAGKDKAYGLNCQL